MRIVFHGVDIDGQRWKLVLQWNALRWVLRVGVRMEVLVHVLLLHQMTMRAVTGTMNFSLALTWEHAMMVVHRLRLR